MAYNNPFWYNRDSSVSSEYKYDLDLSNFRPVYGSSVNFTSRLNYLQTVDNTLKIIPASENNLTVKYNLNFLLNDNDTGSLLKTIEIAGGYRYLKFIDPSNLYKDIVGLVEDYSVSKSSSNLNAINLIISSYFKAPQFNWKTSSFFNLPTSYIYKSLTKYNKYDFVYYDDGSSKNKLDNFWFAKDSINATSTFNKSLWTKKFMHETKFPFELKNKFDIYQMDYKNSFIQNIKHKDNSNTLKQFSLKFENISDSECLSILLFLEKKCGYRRFIYDFPIFLKKAKVFICTEWNHIFKYKNCNDITLTLVEDPNPNIKDLYIDGKYDDLTYVNNIYSGLVDGLAYVNDELATTVIDGTYYANGVSATGVYNNIYYINGSLGTGVYDNIYYENGVRSTKFYNGVYYVNGSRATGLFNGVYYSLGLLGSAVANGIYYLNGYLGTGIINNGYYENGILLFTDGAYDSVNKVNTATKASAKGIPWNPDCLTLNGVIVLYGFGLFSGKLYNNGSLYNGLYDNLFYKSGGLSSTTTADLTTYSLSTSYASGYPSLSSLLNTTTGLHIYGFRLYSTKTTAATGYQFYPTSNDYFYYASLRFNGLYSTTSLYYFNGKLLTGSINAGLSSGIYYLNGVKITNSNAGITYNNYFYQYGYAIISNGFYNNKLYQNGSLYTGMYSGDGKTYAAGVLVQ